MAAPPKIGQTFARAGVSRASSGGGGFSSITGEEQIVTPSGQVISSSGQFSSVSGGPSVPASFADPAVQQANIAKQVNELNQRAGALSARQEAFNIAQAAVNAGRPIPPAAASALGIGSFSQRTGQSAQIQLNRIRKDLRGEQTSFRGDLKTVQATIAIPTSAEQAVGASLVDRGASVSRIQREREIAQTVGPGGVSLVGGGIGQVIYSTPSATTIVQPTRGPTPKTGDVVQDYLITPAGEAFFGQKGTETGEFRFGEYKLVAPRALTGEGAVRRGAETFFSTAYGFKEFGQRVGGAPGAAVGSILGTGAGLFLGAVPIASAPFKALEPGVRRGVSAGTGEGVARPITYLLYDAGPEFAIGLKGIGPATKTATTAFKSFLGTTGSALTKAGKGASIYDASTLTTRIGQGLTGAVRGFELAETGAPILTRAEQVGATVSKVQRGARAVRQSPFVYYPALLGTSVAAAPVGEAIQRASYGPEGRESLIYTPQGTLSATALGYARLDELRASRGARLPSFNVFGIQFGGTTAQIGGELGLGVLGSRPELGGITYQEAKQTFKGVFKDAGLPEKEAERRARIETSAYFSRQSGGLIGGLAIGTTTELGGRATIGRSISTLLDGELIGLTRGEAFKKTIDVAKPQVLKFAGLGATEGVVGTAVADLTSRRAVVVEDIPSQIAQRPLQYALGGIFGSASAATIGTGVITGGLYKTFRGGKSLLGKTTEQGFLNIGYAADPLEAPGDLFANFFSRGEPTFKVARVKGTTTLGSGRFRTTIPSFASVLVSQTTPQKSSNFISNFISAPTSVPTDQPSSIPQNLFIPNNTPVNVNQPSNINEFLLSPPPEDTPLFSDTTETETNVSTNVLISLNVPVGVPVSRVGFPPFFPAAPFGEGSGGGRGRSRKTFFNEYRTAASLLEANLATQGKRIANRERRLFGVPKKRSSKKKSKKKSRGR